MQQEVKKRLRPIHLALKDAIDTAEDQCRATHWRRRKNQVYFYGSFISRLVQEVLTEMNQFSYGWTRCAGGHWMLWAVDRQSRVIKIYFFLNNYIVT